MDINLFHIAHILAKCFKKETLNRQEQETLDRWMQAHPQNAALYDELMQKDAHQQAAWLENLDVDAAWKRLEERQAKTQRRRFWRAAAASIALVCSLGVSFWFLRTTDPQGKQPMSSVFSATGEDVQPANLGAKIILASGQELNVDDTLNMLAGLPAMEEPSLLSSELTAETPVFHTLVVPSANFFKLTLSDGTAVWVNADSELRFPAHFVGEERRVYLKGEAYFEVAKDAEHPFYVDTEQADVRVLGTHFNVAAYGKNVKTSLAEGSVELISSKKSVLIVPGESATSDVTGEIAVHKTNLQRDLAWKDQVFYFKNDNIMRIAAQLKHWYDLDIAFSDNVLLTQTYSGEISRNVNLSEVLDMLSFVSDLKFTLNNNKLLITKKTNK